MNPSIQPDDSPVSDSELDELEAIFDALPVPMEPLDVSALDGFLTGVVLQNPTVPMAQWLPFVGDSEGRPAASGPKAEALLKRLHGFARRRHAELESAVARRHWFDPWIFELDEDHTPSDAVIGWVAGFAIAMDRFPAVMRAEVAATLEPLAVIYSHLDPDDLEDADDLLEEIETLEPPRDLAEAVEGLVSSTLLLADVTRPLTREGGPRGSGRGGRPAPRRPRSAPPRR